MNEVNPGVRPGTLLINSFLILITAFSMLACESSENAEMDGVDMVYGLDTFNSREQLKGEKVDMGLILGPVNLFTHDSLLFIATIGLNINLEVYDLKNNYKKLGSIIRAGQGPDEMLSVFKMSFNDDNSFWAHDIVAMQMKKFELTLNSDTIFATMQDMVAFQIPSILEAGVLGNKRIVTTTHDINPLSRFYVYDMDGRRIGTPAEYPSYGREIPSTTTVEVYSGHMTVHPGGDKFLFAYDYTDLIEIYDANANLKKRIQGPYIFQPQFDLTQRGEYYFMKRLADVTRQAYVQAESNKDLIMLLSADGRTRKPKEGEAGIHHSHLITLDWEGKPLNMYELDHAIAAFAVDWKRRKIYGLDRIESEVYAFNF